STDRDNLRGRLDRDFHMRPFPIGVTLLGRAAANAAMALCGVFGAPLPVGGSSGVIRVRVAGFIPRSCPASRADLRSCCRIESQGFGYLYPLVVSSTHPALMISRSASIHRANAEQ